MQHRAGPQRVFLSLVPPEQAWSLTDNGSTSFGLLNGCAEIVLDCSNASDVNRTIWLDRKNPIKYPAIRCSGRSDRVLRIFYNTTCKLWREDNPAGCYWCG